MSLHKLWVNPCPKCHHDVAKPIRARGDEPVAPYFGVVCFIGSGGCGHGGPVVKGEGAAIDAWNSTTLLHWVKELAE